MRATTLLAATLIVLSGCGEADPPDPTILSEIRGDALRISGSLEGDDNTLQSGELMDAFAVDADAGQTLEVSLRSDAFVPYIIVQGPGEQREEVSGDDADRDLSLSVPIDEAGHWRVVATTRAPGEQGAYTLGVDVTGARTDTTIAPGLRTYRGTLTETDTPLTSGEYSDEYTFNVQPGDRIVADVRSNAFSPYLILVKPDEEQDESRDLLEDRSRARVETTFEEAGTVRVLVTSDEVGESGDYIVALQHDRVGG